MLNGDSNKNGKKINRFNLLAKNNFARAAHFFELASYTSYVGNVLSSCSLFLFFRETLFFI